jgi:tetratricopeptide (TPR) repeat protein
MKPVPGILFALTLALPGGERERGLQAYREGRFAEAAAAFRAAIEHDGDSPELQWNLALASWRAGDLAAAETAVEKYAAASKDARVELHAGLLGAIRHAEANALEAQADAAAAAPPPAAAPQPAAPAAPADPGDPLPLLEQALAKATQARDHFVRGATAAPTPELQRNTERTLRTIDALQRRIDELKKQREQQPKQEPDDQQDEKQKQQPDETSDEKKPEPEKQPDEKGEQPDEKTNQKPEEKPGEKPAEQQPDQKPPGEQQQQQQPQSGESGEQPEPKQAPEPRDGKGAPEPSGAEQQQQGQPQPDARPGQPRDDAPGERVEGRVLSPEQTQRLLQQLEQLDEKQKALRARMKSGRKRVERDW